VPTWGNHHGVFGAAGLVVKTYRYYHPQSRALDYQVRLLVGVSFVGSRQIEAGFEL